MKRLLIISALSFQLSALATTYTEFYVQPTGNNLNAGSSTDDAAIATFTSGNWTNATVTFVPASGWPATRPMVGDWVSIFPDATTTNCFVTLVTATNSTAITCSSTAKAGTAPADGVAATTLKCAGAWKGPNTTESTLAGNYHPFNFVTATLTNVGGYVPCVNFLSSTYSVTNAMTHALAGPVWFSGYTNSPRDGGRATIDGGRVTSGYILFTTSASGGPVFQDLTFNNNGTNGTSVGVTSSGSGSWFFRCAVFNMRGSGFFTANCFGCEAATNCIANGNNTAGFDTCNTWYCNSHDNVGSTVSGYFTANAATTDHCIAYRNGGNGGIRNSGNANTWAVYSFCNIYSNAGPGIELTGNGPHQRLILNCNIFNNKTYGIKASAGSPTGRMGFILNNVFGSGTQTNVSGNLDPTLTGGLQNGLDIQGNVIYAADDTPWVDPTNANFTVKSTATTKAGGWATFTQLSVNSPTNTVSYPDIGAAQGASTNSGAAAVTRSYPFGL
jgi:hypothetical protein